MRRTRARARPSVPIILLGPREARIIHTLGGYARVLSEPANKLVCGGLPHCESFVINLLGGNARTHTTSTPPRCTEVETRRVSNLPGLFLRFLARELEVAHDIQCGIFQNITDSTGIFTALLFAGGKCLYDIPSYNSSADLEYGCGKLTTNFYDALKRLTTDSNIERLLDFVTNSIRKSTRFFYD